MEENKAFRKRIKELQEADRRNEKNYKKQQEYVVVLEQRYRLLCANVGISASLNFSRITQQADITIPAEKKLNPAAIANALNATNSQPTIRVGTAHTNASNMNGLNQTTMNDVTSQSLQKMPSEGNSYIQGRNLGKITL